MKTAWALENDQRYAVSLDQPAWVIKYLSNFLLKSDSQPIPLAQIEDSDLSIFENPVHTFG